MLLFLWTMVVLASYRLSLDIALERGPFDVFIRVRSFFTQYGVAKSKIWLSEGINCPVCVSFWLPWFMGGLLLVDAQMSAPLFMLTCLGASGAVRLLLQLRRV